MSQSEQESTPSSLQRWLQRLGVDRAIGFAVLARIWQLAFGPISQLTIVFCLTKTEQGTYHAFLNLLAAQIFAELGLHVVLINVSSHEWRLLHLKDGRIQGDERSRSRLISLGRTAFAWYSVAAVLFAAAVGYSGYQYLTEHTPADGGTQWSVAWWILVTLTSLQMPLLPLTSLLEGCGQLATVNRWRLVTTMCGTVGVISALLSGFGVAALCVSAGIRLVGECWLSLSVYRRFFGDFLRPQPSSDFRWNSEVLPLQWRMAVQGPMLWLASHMAGLVLYARAPTDAGRYGMSWTILSGLQAAALAWIDTRRPEFGSLIAGANYAELDRRFFRYSAISTGMMAVGAFLMPAGAWLLTVIPWWVTQKIAERLLSPSDLLILGAGFITMHLAQCTNIYVRAHKRDPFLIPAVLSNLCIAGLVLELGRRLGPTGVAAGYTAGVTLVQTPLWITIWHKTRREWH